MSFELITFQPLSMSEAQRQPDAAGLIGRDPIQGGNIGGERCGVGEMSQAYVVNRGGVI